MSNGRLKIAECGMKMKLSKEDKFVVKALSKMFDAVGVKYTAEYCKKQDWFMLHDWSDEQIDTYKKWFMSAIRKDLKLNKNRAEREWQYFFFQWGWKHREAAVAE